LISCRPGSTPLKISLIRIRIVRNDRTGGAELSANRFAAILRAPAGPVPGVMIVAGGSATLSTVPVKAAAALPAAPHGVEPPAHEQRHSRGQGRMTNGGSDHQTQANIL
jgi:hypothetical protein